MKKVLRVFFFTINESYNRATVIIRPLCVVWLKKRNNLSHTIIKSFLRFFNFIIKINMF